MDTFQFQKYFFIFFANPVKQSFFSKKLNRGAIFSPAQIFTYFTFLKPMTAYLKFSSMLTIDISI